MLYDKRWDAKVKPSAATILRNARALIENEENWCGYGPRDGNKRCALIAITDSGGDMRAWNYIQRFMPLGVSIGQWNDSSTHAEVIAAFDRAIELARQDQ